MMNKPQVLDSKIVYGNPWLKVRKDTITQDGTQKDYFIVERSAGVVAIPLTPDHVTVMLKQYRHPIESLSLEFPMGAMEKNETPEKALHREVFEEIGLEVNNYIKIGAFRPGNGYTSEETYVYVVPVTDQQLTNLQSHDQEEDIQGIYRLHIDSVKEAVSSGKITDGFTLASLAFLETHVHNHA